MYKRLRWTGTKTSIPPVHTIQHLFLLFAAQHYSSLLSPCLSPQPGTSFLYLVMSPRTMPSMTYSLSPLWTYTIAILPQLGIFAVLNTNNNSFREKVILISPKYSTSALTLQGSIVQLFLAHLTSITFNIFLSAAPSLNVMQHSSHLPFLDMKG